MAGKRIGIRERILKPSSPPRVRINRVSAVGRACPFTKKSPNTIITGTGMVEGAAGGGGQCPKGKPRLSGRMRD